jgi:SAM-dependent methyltransferase
MPDPTEVPHDWARWRDQVDLTDYDERWRRMAARGRNPHGEADLVVRYRPASVLDAGCGTGRVGIELARRGVRVVGVDADPDMIAAARSKAPELDWRHVDLSALECDERFDVVLLAGNVVPYVAAGRRADAVRRCAGALASGGRLIAGFSLCPGWPTPDDYDRWCTGAGLALQDRFATWDGAPYAGADYLVTVYRSPPR